MRRVPPAPRRGPCGLDSDYGQPRCHRHLVSLTQQTPYGNPTLPDITLTRPRPPAQNDSRAASASQTTREPSPTRRTVPISGRCVILTRALPCGQRARRAWPKSAPPGRSLRPSAQVQGAFAAETVRGRTDHSPGRNPGAAPTCSLPPSEEIIVPGTGISKVRIGEIGRGEVREGSEGDPGIREVCYKAVSANYPWPACGRWTCRLRLGAPSSPGCGGTRRRAHPRHGDHPVPPRVPVGNPVGLAGKTP